MKKWFTGFSVLFSDLMTKTKVKGSADIVF